MNTKGKILVAVGVVFAIILISKLGEPPSKPMTPEQIAEQKKSDSLQIEVEKQTKILREIRYLVKSHVKKNLKDPDSFDEIEHEEFEVTNKTRKLHYQASIKYRAKNSFGGYAVEKWCFNFNKNLENTKVFECD